MRIAILGAGGVGGYFGGRLAAGGTDVAFVARGAHLTALRERGLTVRVPEGVSTMHVTATDDPTIIGPVDVVLLSVKAYDTMEAVRGATPLMRDDTAVVSLQNGIENEEVIARIIGWPRVVGGAAYIFASIESPGVIVAAGPRRLVFGEWRGGAPTPRLDALREACEAVGIPASIPPDIRVAIWEKFVFLVAFSAVSAAVRLPLAEIRDSPRAWRLMEGIAAEAWRVGRAEGIDLSDDCVSRQIALARSLDKGFVASLQHDLVAGRRMEVDSLQGALARRGRAVGVPTPLTDTTLAILEPWARRNDAGRASADT